MRHGLNIRCPSCHGPLEARMLECTTCGIRVEGIFGRSEFDQLDEDELHFLRMFVHCEGRIRDLEKALGISYPTVKSRLTALKEKLGLGGTLPVVEASIPEDSSAAPSDVIDALERGEISPDEAVERLKT